MSDEQQNRLEAQPYAMMNQQLGRWDGFYGFTMRQNQQSAQASVPREPIFIDWWSILGLILIATICMIGFLV